MKHFYIIAFLFSSFAYSQIPSGYYDNTNGLEGYTLKTVLKTIIDGIDDGNGQPFHDTSVTYGQLWELYETSDVRPDGKVWDMYSDCDFTFTEDQDTGTSGTQECQIFNREHSFPRSWFGDDQSNAIFTDPFHVIPSDKKVNSIRGNLAFGEVASANYTSLNGSKRGSSAISGPTGDVFEQIDSIDLIIVPGIAFDKNMNRLGRGKAYYDKLLKDTNAFKAGVCFDFQIIQRVPAESHDVKMDDVIFG